MLLPILPRFSPKTSWVKKPWQLRHSLTKRSSFAPRQTSLHLKRAGDQTSLTRAALIVRGPPTVACPKSFRFAGESFRRVNAEPAADGNLPGAVVEHVGRPLVKMLSRC